jgi:hypothetical protein
MRLKLSNSNSFIIFLFPLFYFLVSFMLFRWRTSVTCKKFLHFIWKKVREMQTPFHNWLQVSTENITTAVNNIVCLIVGKNVHFFQYIIAIPKIKWNKIRRIILVLPFKKNERISQKLRYTVLLFKLIYWYIEKPYRPTTIPQTVKQKSIGYYFYL